MINWTPLLLQAQKGALRFPLRIPGYGVVHDKDELVRQADPNAIQNLSKLNARAAFLAKHLGGPPARWIDVVQGTSKMWNAVEHTLRGKWTKPEQPFHIGHLTDTVYDPTLLRDVLTKLEAIAHVAGDPSLIPGPDTRRVHIHGTIPGTTIPFQGRWAAEPGVLGSFQIPFDTEALVGVLPTWHHFLHTTPRPGAVLLWPDHGPWSLRQLDWLLDAHTHIWVATRSDLEEAARLRNAFGRVVIHLPTLDKNPHSAEEPPVLHLTQAEKTWWKARGTNPHVQTHPPEGFAKACLHLS